ncbi:phage tail tape measure protein [Enterococcus faecium]|nr:phage tail tape measure protein [Enterococcus faecium]
MSKSTLEMSRQEWIEDRKKGIGGSDVGTILGLNKWKSPYQLWLEKTGQVVLEETASEPAYWGNILEEVVAKEFQERTGKKVRRRNQVFEHPLHPFLRANIDRDVVGENAILECKTANQFLGKEWEGEEVPLSYLCQVQHYMNVLNKDYCYIAVLIGGQKFIWKRIERDQELIDTIDDGNSVQKISSDLNGLKSDANKADDALDKIGDTLEEIDDKIDKGNLLDAGEFLSEMSGKAKDMASNTIEAFMEVEDAQAKLNASMGVAGTESAKKYEQALKDIFSSGLFDDMNEAADAVALVSKNLGDMNSQELNQIVQNVKVLEKTFGVDLAETIRGVAALQKHYGATAEESLDMITVALQRNGSTWADEVGDNLAEYAMYFKQNGYSMKKMFETLEAGTKAGAYNLDKVNDVLKEMGIRLSDGSVKTAIEELGGEWQNLYDTMSKGGASNEEIFEALVQKISEVGTEQEKATLISSIFGSLGEDNGIKVMEALAGVGKEAENVKGAYDNIAGASDKLNNDTTTTSQKMQGAWNELKLALAPLGQELALALVPLLDSLTEILKMFQNLPGPVKTFIVAFLGIGTLIGIITGVVVALGALAGIVGGPVVVALGIFVAAVAGAITVIKNWGSITDWFSDKWNKLKEWWSKFWSQFSGPADAAFKILSNSVKTLASFMFGSFDDKLKAIKNLFKFLKLKFPKIELPPMPHFSLKWSSNKVFGKKISFPSGIDVKWFADGGILTKPTIFGASGNKLLGGGEAGKEAVAPLNKLMAYIQKAVDVGLSKQQATDEIHLHLTAYGNLPKETLDQIAEYLMYKFVDLKNKNEFSG